MKILVTGFDIFAGGTINPSWEMIKNLPSSLGEHTLIVEKLPVVYSSIKDELESLITLNKPDLIIMFGLDENVPYPKVESYGWNHAGTYPDNDGVILNAPLFNNTDARVGYEVPYNYYDVLRWMGNNDFDVRLSLDGGSYLCNAAIYYTGYILEQKGLDTPYFFSHVPAERNLSIVDAEKYAMLIIQGMVNEKSHHKIDFSADFDFTSELTFTNKADTDYDASGLISLKYDISPVTFSERTIIKLYGEFESNINNNRIAFFLHDDPGRVGYVPYSGYGDTYVTLNKGLNHINVYLEVPSNTAVGYLYLRCYKASINTQLKLNVLIKSSTIAMGVINSGYRPPNKVEKTNDLIYNIATTSVDGLMSSEDKVKLNEIASGAQVNPTIATQAQAEAGTDNTSMVTPLRAKQAIEKLAPTPPLASTSANGLMSSTDKVKLNGIQASPSIASQLEALTGTNNTNIMTPLRTKEVILESATIVVNHGTNSSMARPSGASVVYWIGTVVPTNATNNDLWVGGL